MQYKETVKLIKQTGLEIEGIVASCQPNRVFIRDAEVPVEVDDIIERKLPNGIIERWIIDEPGYYGGHSGFPAYQCKVSREGKTSKAMSSSAIYNISGHNTKVNINSHDESITHIGVDSKDVFEKLCEVINDQLNSDAQLIQAIQDMKKEKDNSGFLQKYTHFISLAKDHISLIAPFIPALTQMIK